MTNYSHLTREQRNNIEYLISLNKNFTYIGKSINVDRTTISKEIKRNRYIKSNYFDKFDKKGIVSATLKCDFLKKPPYVCNSCPNKRYCNNHKLYYNAYFAQTNSDTTLSESRSGVDISPHTIDEIENSIIPLIKNKNQSVNQVYINHSDILYFCKSTFYKYVDLGRCSKLDVGKQILHKKRENTQKLKTVI